MAGPILHHTLSWSEIINAKEFNSKGLYVTQYVHQITSICNRVYILIMYKWLDFWETVLSCRKETLYLHIYPSLHTEWPKAGSHGQGSFLQESKFPKSKTLIICQSPLRPVHFDANTCSNSVKLQSATQLFKLSLTNILVTKCLTTLARNTSIRSK